MRKTDVLKHYKTATAVAAALEVSVAAVSQWGDLVPPASAHRLSQLTDGELRFDPRSYRHSSEQRRRIAEALSV